MNTPTIAAAATGSGRSAIGIVRLSGPAAISAASAIFTPAAGGSLADAPDRTLVYGVLRDQEGQVIDRPLATVSRAPHSYTGEDTAELQCHGSPAVLTMALEALYAQGVQPAPPGEFTKRAFLNGRMDLAQAEAVADLIDAETEACVHHAAGQLGGALSRRVEAIYSRLVDLMAHFHAVLDYPDEDIDPFGAHDIRQALADAGQQLDGLLATYQRGRLLSQGVPCAIVGKPNAGKSSLLNALLGYDRAIVTPIAGTTRDTIEERIKLGGVLLRLIDTAGLREAADEVERIGVERSRAAVEQAELVLVVLDCARPLDEEDQAALRLAQSAPHCILVHNKIDLPASAPATLPRLDPMPPVVEVSALTGEGLDELELAIETLFLGKELDVSGDLLTNARQADAARRARESLERAGAALAAGVTPDAVLTDVEEALSALGELTGKSVRSDITSRIFERFCVGK